MKNIFTLIAILISAIFMAQAPNLLSYQAVVRNAANQLVINQNVGVKFSILKSSATGAVVYAETQNSTTNSNGLFTTNIGSGTVISGSMASINWANDVYFIKSEIDLAGGSNYTITGTQQLLSVPYALNAKNGIPNGGTANQVLAKVDGTDYNTQWVTPSGSDNLGNHTATTALNMNSNAITGATNITATGTATLGGNTYPTNTGTNGQVLTTDGAGATQWATPSGSSGPIVVFRGYHNTTLGLPANLPNVNPNQVFFNNVQSPLLTNYITEPSTGVNVASTVFDIPVINGRGFIVQQAGLYMINCNLASSTQVQGAPIPMLEINPGNSASIPSSPTTRIYGTGISNFTTTTSSWQTHGRGRGQLTTFYYFNVGDSFYIRGQNSSNSGQIFLNNDQSSNLTIIKF